MSQFSKQLETKIQGKINGILNGTVDAKGSGVNSLIQKLKELDEAAATAMQKKYIEAVQNASKKK